MVELKLFEIKLVGTLYKMFIDLAQQSRGTQQRYCVCMRGICDISHQIRGEVSDAI